jgi:putative transposase
MRLMELEAIYPKRKTITPNQVWASDISYLPMEKGFISLVAIMDWYSRKVLSCRVSDTMDSDFCVSALKEAIHNYGRPEIFNTDQHGRSRPFPR